MSEIVEGVLWVLQPAPSWQHSSSKEVFIDVQSRWTDTHVSEFGLDPDPPHGTLHGPLLVDNSAVWLAGSAEEEGLPSDSPARPPAVCSGFGGEARGRFLWAVASVKSREESGQHDDQHQVQKPDPGENRWAWFLGFYPQPSDCWGSMQWSLHVSVSLGVALHPCTCASSSSILWWAIEDSTEVRGILFMHFVFFYLLECFFSTVRCV